MTGELGTTAVTASLTLIWVSRSSLKKIMPSRMSIAVVGTPGRISPPIRIFFEGLLRFLLIQRVSSGNDCRFMNEGART